MTFTLTLKLKIAQIILQSVTVRIHSEIARRPWARLWYLCRAFDLGGVGGSELPVDLILALLDISEATLYRYINSGKQAGAFRLIKISDGILKTWLGSLNAVCRKLEIRDWGEVGEVSLGKFSATYDLSPPG